MRVREPGCVRVCVRCEVKNNNREKRERQSELGCASHLAFFSLPFPYIRAHAVLLTRENKERVRRDMCRAKGGARDLSCCRHREEYRSTTEKETERAREPTSERAAQRNLVSFRDDTHFGGHLDVAQDFAISCWLPDKPRFAREFFLLFDLSSCVLLLLLPSPCYCCCSLPISIVPACGWLWRVGGEIARGGEQL